MLVPMKEILEKATKEGYGVVAATSFDTHTVGAALQAAEELRSPLILLNGDRGGIFTYAKTVLPLIRDCRMPVALILDHGGSFESVMRAIRAGFSSVMFDCSRLPFDENVRNVKEVTRIAKPLGITVEAELGRLTERNEGADDSELPLTDPDEAREYVKQTEIDCFAPAIGNAHGIYKGKPSLDYDRLEKIRKVVDIPLVLHGGSNTGDEALQKAIKCGISKINIATDLRNAAFEGMKAHIAENPKANINTTINAGAEAYKQVLMKYMRLFGSPDKA